MFTLSVDKTTGDLTFDSQKNLTYVSDKDEQVQSVRLLLSTNKGEWFLNTIYGLAYKYLQVKNPRLNIIRAEILKTLSQEERITSVNSLTVVFDSSSRELTINFNLTMNDGNTIQGNEVLTG